MAKPKKLKANKQVEGKRAKKTEKEEDGKISTTELSIRNSRLWEIRLALSESEQKAFRKKNNELVEQIYGLQELVHNSEKDIVNVIAYLKDIDETKSVKIVELQAELRTRRNAYERERDELESRLRERIQQLSSELAEKEEIVRNQWQKLESIREFLEERQQMEAEILKLKLELRAQKLCYDEKVKLLELRCYTDKKKREADFEKTVKDISKRAHQQAREHLMKAAQTALKQNTELRQDVELQSERASDLAAQLTAKEGRNRKLQIIKEELEASALEHHRKLNSVIEENGKLRTEVKELQEMVECFKTQVSEQNTAVQIQLQHGSQEATVQIERIFQEVRLEKLRAARIKALGEKILQERSAIEVFFLSALREIREEINNTRKEYTKAAETAFRHQMVLASKGKSNYPRIRTFQRGLPNSTNSVFKDFEAAETRMLTADKQSSLSDLTLEQKEHVLCRLFEKINASRIRPLQPSPKVPQEDNPSDRTASVQSILPALVNRRPNERNVGEEDDSTTVTTKLSPDSLSPAELTVQPSAGQLSSERPDGVLHISEDAFDNEQHKGTEVGSLTSGCGPASEKIQTELTFQTEQVGPQVTNDRLFALEEEDTQIFDPSGLQAKLSEQLQVQPLMIEGNESDRLSISKTDLQDDSVTGVNIIERPSTGVVEGSHQEDNRTELKRGERSHEQKTDNPASPKQPELSKADKGMSRDSKVSNGSKLNGDVEKMHHDQFGRIGDAITSTNIKNGTNEARKLSIKIVENDEEKPDEKKTSGRIAKENENLKCLEGESEFAGKEQELEPEDRPEIEDKEDVEQVGEKRRKDSPELEKLKDSNGRVETE